MKRLLTLGGFFFGALAAFAQAPNTPADSGAVIEFDSRNFEFGKALQGDLIKHDFVVSNAGTAILTISDVHPSCGCTTAGTWPHELEPGKSGIIPIQINSRNLSGSVKKTVTITSNDRHSPTVLTLGGQVIKSIDVAPAFARFNIIAGATNAPASVVKISNRTENPLSIKSAESDTGAFRVSEVKTLEDGKEYEISVTANPPFARGTNGTVLVSTGWSNYVIRVPVYLTVQPAIMSQPHAITVPAQLDHQTTYKVTLYSIRPEDSFSDPQSSDDRIAVTMTNSTVGRTFYTLTAVVPAGYKATPGHAANITVKTTDAQTPVVTIPILQSASFQAAQAGQPPRIRQTLPAISSSGAVTPPPVPGAH
jgi:hypothetical protein